MGLLRFEVVYFRKETKIMYVYGKGEIYKMEKIFTKAEAIELYGTDKQNEYFKKYKKIQKTMEEALILTLEQNYEVVEKVKVGHSICYKVSSKRTVIAERKDNRITNGRQTDYTKSMDAIVIAGLEKRRTSGEVGEQTMRKWLLDFGLINRELFDLLNAKYNEKKFDETFKFLVEKKYLNSQREKKVLNDYIYFSNNLNQQLKNSLEKMNKAGIVEFLPIPYAKVETEYKKIEPSTYQIILEKKTELMELFSLSNFEVISNTPTKKLKSFKLAYKNYLENDVEENGVHLKIEYVYKSYLIFRIGTKAAIRKYLKKNNKEAFEAFEKDELKFVEDSKLKFMGERLKYILNKANLEVNKKKKYQDERITEYMEYNRIDEEDVILQNVFFFDYEYQKLIMNNLYVESIKNLQTYFGTL